MRVAKAQGGYQLVQEGQLGREGYNRSVNGVCTNLGVWRREYLEDILIEGAQRSLYMRARGQEEGIDKDGGLRETELPRTVVGVSEPWDARHFVKPSSN